MILINAKMKKKLKNKKIFHIIGSLKPFGGTEKFLLNLINKSYNNNKIILILLSNNGKIKNKINRNVKIRIFDLSNLILFIKNIVKLCKYYNEEKPSFVFTWLYHANFISLFLFLVNKNSSFFWNIRHSRIYSFNSFKSFISFHICKFISNKVPKEIIYNSFSAKKFHEAKGYSKKNSRVIFNGVNLNKIGQKHRSNKIILGMSSRWHKDKNHENLFQAITKLKYKNFKLILCGQKINNKNEDLLYLLKKYNINNYELLGEIANMKKFFNKININLLSSDTESFPNAIIESMSFGVPSVSTNVGDVKNIMKKSGIIVKKRSSILFAKGIDKLINEKLFYSKLWNLRKKSCLKISKNNFNWKRTLDNYERLIKI